MTFYLWGLASIWRNMNSTKKERKDSPLTKLLINQEYQLQTRKAAQLLFHLSQKYLPVIHPLHGSMLTTPINGYVVDYFMHEWNTSLLPLLGSAPVSCYAYQCIQQFWRALSTAFYTFSEYCKTSAHKLSAGNVAHWTLSIFSAIF